MNAEELIKLLEENMTVEEFAFEDVPYDYNENDEDFKTAEAEKKIWLANNPDPGWGKEGRDEWLKEYYLIPSGHDVARDKWYKNKNIPKWEEVEQVGGEGQGDTWYSVKYFKDLDIYLNVDGWYSSYNGTDIDGWGAVTEVRPTEKTIIVYV